MPRDRAKGYFTPIQCNIEKVSIWKNLGQSNHPFLQRQYINMWWGHFGQKGLRICSQNCNSIFKHIVEFLISLFNIQALSSRVLVQTTDQSVKWCNTRWPSSTKICANNWRGALAACGPLSTRSTSTSSLSASTRSWLLRCIIVH